MTAGAETESREVATSVQSPSGAVDGATTKRLDDVALCTRFASHVAVWISVLLPAVLVLARGWSPLGDYAAIELRAYRSLSLHPPLVGMYSTASSGIAHKVFDPGPLSFWMLATPTHIDPAHGLIWGSALLWGLVLSLAIEAMWSSGHRIGVVLIPLALIDLLWAAPSVLENLAWNANLPLPFFCAAIVTAFVVAQGKFGWWPVLVFAASVAAQTHLLYVLPALGLVLVAPVVGIVQAGRPKRFRWLVTGIGIAGLCWGAPLAQNLGAHGNLSALAGGTGGAPTLGFGFGFRLLGDGAGLVPLWLEHLPTRFYPDMAFAYSHQPAYGVGALCAILLVTALGALTRRRGLFALGAATAVTTSAFLASFSLIPISNLIVVDYLLGVVWVESFLIWILTIWGLLSASRSLVDVIVKRRNLNLSKDALRLGLAPTWARATAARRAAIALLGLMAGETALAIASTIPASANFGTNWNPQEAGAVTRIVSVVERNIPRGDVNISIDGPAADRLSTIAISEGVGLRLLLNGWHPGLRGIDAALTSLPPIPRSAEVYSRITGNAVQVIESQGAA